MKTLHAISLSGAVLASCGDDAGKADAPHCYPAPCPSSAAWDYERCRCVPSDGGAPVVVGSIPDGGVACTERTVRSEEGASAVWPNVCVHSVFEEASAALYDVCIVDETGKLATTTLRGDLIITNPGWGCSAHGNGNIPSTLSGADEQRCNAALVALPPKSEPGTSVRDCR